MKRLIVMLSSILALASVAFASDKKDEVKVLSGATPLQKPSTATSPLVEAANRARNKAKQHMRIDQTMVRAGGNSSRKPQASEIKPAPYAVEAPPPRHTPSEAEMIAAERQRSGEIERAERETRLQKAENELATATAEIIEESGDPAAGDVDATERRAAEASREVENP